MENIFLW